MKKRPVIVSKRASSIISVLSMAIIGTEALFMVSYINRVPSKSPEQIQLESEMDYVSNYLEEHNMILKSYPVYVGKLEDGTYKKDTMYLIEDYPSYVTNGGIGVAKVDISYEDNGSIKNATYYCKDFAYSFEDLKDLLNKEIGDYELISVKPYSSISFEDYTKENYDVFSNETPNLTDTLVGIS